MLSAIFSIPLKPMIDVTAAIVFAFMMGLGISALRKNNKGEVLYKIAFDFQGIIQMVLAKAIIPLYITGTFANIAFVGQDIKCILESLHSSNVTSFNICGTTIYSSWSICK